MYPYDIIPGTGINLYVICLGLAAVAAILTFSKLADIANIRGRVQNLCVYTAIFAIVAGYGSAVLFQAFYNMLASGEFSINKGTGATFYGGLIGGVISFIVIYFIWGRFKFDDDSYKTQFIDVVNVAPASISIAHSIGRIGCLMAGCCYGKETNAWYGITMVEKGVKVVPTQLLEAIFLALIFALVVIRVKEKKRYNMPIYMIGYGAWRYVIELLRGDYRGKTIVPSLSPSQLIALIMIVSGVILFFILKKIEDRRDEMSCSEEESEDE